MASPAVVRIREVLRYPLPQAPEPSHLDGLHNFFHLTQLNGDIIVLNSGVGVPAAVHAPEGPRRPVIMIRSNPFKYGSHDTPWEDEFDLDNGHITYFGDHKAATTGPLGSTTGNKHLLLELPKHTAPTREQRLQAVPLPIFRAVARNGQNKGYMEFCGLGVLQEISEVEQEDPQTKVRFPNYVCQITLLSLAPEGEQFDWNWINARRDPNLDLEQTLAFAPASWQTWVQEGNHVLPQIRHGSTTSGTPFRNPDWTWDELVLVVDLVAGNNWHELRQTDAEVIKLSELLNAAPIHPASKRREDFRSVNSVSRKSADIQTNHPNYEKKPTRGGQLEKKVIDAFIEHPEQMAATAAALRELLESDESETYEATPLEDTDAEFSVIEGQLLARRHFRRERNAKMRARKLAAMKKAGLPLTCEICDFNYGNFYGEHGEGYIEVHHKVPLHVSGETVTKLDDLAVICANCHRMCHRRLINGSWPSPAELKNLLK